AARSSASCWRYSRRKRLALSVAASASNWAVAIWLVRLEASLLRREYRQQLAELRAAHLRDLEELDASIARMRQSIADARVVSPISGTVTDLPVNTFDRVARGGEILAVISQPLAEPVVELHVPAAYVDQVREGQEGLLTISSLPQRGIPQIRVSISAIAAEPVKDPSGQTQHYRAAGRIDPEGISLAQDRLGKRFNLTRGMPVSAALVGPPTTLWTYVTEPITSMWDTAFES
ncbi:MAG: HlyD family efflux transporter periplasmic adaptor subunit, partial [Pseudomonadota bacterium]